LNPGGLLCQKQMNILNKVKDQASEQEAIDDTAESYLQFLVLLVLLGQE